MKKYHKMHSETQVGIEKQSKLSEIAAPTLQYIQYRKSTHTILSCKNNEKKVRKKSKKSGKMVSKTRVRTEKQSKMSEIPPPTKKDPPTPTSKQE